MGSIGEGGGGKSFGSSFAAPRPGALAGRDLKQVVAVSGNVQVEAG